MERVLLFTAYAFYPGEVYDALRFSIDRGIHDDRLVLTLFFFINFFIANFLLISLISLAILIAKSVRERKIKALSEKYQNLLAEYVCYDDASSAIPEEIRKIGNDRLKRSVLISQIIRLNKNLFGVAKERLRDLFMKLNLNEDSVRYVKNPKWHIQAKGFRQLAQMNITDANNLIEDKLNSENEILSFEAQLAMVQLNHDAPFSFLGKIKKYFPLWNQLNIQILINSNNIKVPEFSGWLKSANNNVVVFALRMIRIFQQQKAFADIIPLLNHIDAEVKNNSIITLGRLGLNEASLFLKNIYSGSADKTKILILKALQNLPDESNIKFLGDALLDNDNNIKIEAAKALLCIGELGRNKLQFTRMSAQVDNADIVSIIDRSLDKRIV
jgi:hypothetical protein